MAGNKRLNVYNSRCDQEFPTTGARAAGFCSHGMLGALAHLKVLRDDMIKAR